MASIPIYVPVRPTPALQSTKGFGYQEGMACPSPTLRGQQSARERKWKCVTTGYEATENSSCCKLIGNTNNDEFVLWISFNESKANIAKRGAYSQSSLTFIWLLSKSLRILRFYRPEYPSENRPFHASLAASLSSNRHKIWDQPNTFASSLVCIASRHVHLTLT